MPTLTLNAQSVAYPSISDRIEATVYDEADPLAVVASIIDTTSGHPSRYWTFLGLPRANYNFQLNVIDGSGNPTQNLANFDVVPGNIDGALVRASEVIRVGTTPGLTAGTNTFTFDGTGSKPDYRGWTFNLFEVGGRDPLTYGVDYTYDETTGTLLLLASGDEFQPSQYYTVIFDAIENPSGGSIPLVIDFKAQLVTADYSIQASDFSSKLIFEPSGFLLTAILPPIATVVAGRLLMVEVGNPVPASPSSEVIKCVQIIPQSGETINFLRGNIYALPNECLVIYKFIRSSGVYEWRVYNYDGNFKTVGREVGTDATSDWNVQEYDGSSILSSQYARLYNEFVLQLPSGQVVNYDDWSTGNNKYLFSLANSANPTFAGQFMVPDRRGIFERNTANGGNAGDFQLDMFKSHTHNEIVYQAINNGGQKPVGYSGTSAGTFDSGVATGATGGTETRPINISINRLFYV